MKVKPSRVAIAVASFAVALPLAGAETSCGRTVAHLQTPRGVALRSPIDVQLRRNLLGPRSPHPEPPMTPPTTPPVIDVPGVSYYVDAARSEADVRLWEENASATRPIREFLHGVIALADAWMQVAPPRLAAASSAVDALAGWARAGALLGRATRQGEYERAWTLGGLAIAYLKVRDAPGLAAAARTDIDAWFRALGALVRTESEQVRRSSSVNNHACWAGMAVMAAGIASNDRALYEWGLGRARLGIAQIDPDGLLPLEMARGALALHYHVFTLAPLVMLAEMAAANGVDLYDENGGALRRLGRAVIAALADPVRFGQRVGIAQRVTLPPARSDLAWAEPYHARFRDRRLRTWLLAARPLVDVRLGGSTTAAFGIPEL